MYNSLIHHHIVTSLFAPDLSEGQAGRDRHPSDGKLVRLDLMSDECV